MLNSCTIERLEVPEVTNPFSKEIKEYVSNLASVSRNKKESSNYEVRFQQLMTEGSLDTPSRPFEFVPIAHNDNMYNMRQAIKCNFQNYKVGYHNLQFNIRLKVPMFLWSQLMTHTTISKVSQSDRVSTEEEYWYPEGMLEKLNIKDFKEDLLDIYPQPKIQAMLKEVGYKKEIYQRAPYYFKMKTFIMGAEVINKNTWINLFLERAGLPASKNWVQGETQQVVYSIYTLFKNEYKHIRLFKELFEAFENKHTTVTQIKHLLEQLNIANIEESLKSNSLGFK